MAKNDKKNVFFLFGPKKSHFLGVVHLKLGYHCDGIEKLYPIMVYIDTLEHLFGGQRRFFGKKSEKLRFLKFLPKEGIYVKYCSNPKGQKVKVVQWGKKIGWKVEKSGLSKQKKKFWGIFRQKNPWKKRHFWP